MMGRSRESRRARGPLRTVRPMVEALDGRVLLSATPLAGGKLGPFIEPGAMRPRIHQTPTVVDAAPVLNRYLIALLGSDEVEPVRAQAAARGVSARAILYQRVLAQPLVNSVFGSLDTYSILGSPAASALVGFVEVQPTTQATVRYNVSPANLISLGSESSTVQIPPDGTLAGFIATVPTVNVRPLPDGSYQVDVPVDQIPSDAPAPPAATVGTGALSDTYRATGPVLSDALLTGRHQRGPNSPAVVRGLRLTRSLGDPRLISPATQSTYLRLMRVAVERDAFTPTSEQSQQIATDLQQFFVDLDQLSAAGTFTPAVPPATPPNLFAGARLGNTLQVTNGALRDLVNVAQSQSGLPLLGLNFPGRIDAGFIIAANGDYGLILTARGPLQDAPAGFATDIVGGDLRLEVSNAASITELNGLRVQEGTYVGSVLSGEITGSRTSRPNGDLVTLGASAGFGTGLAFGTGVSYSKVIPLGNLNALLPQYPKG